jgi:hypothetical protein
MKWDIVYERGKKDMGVGKLELGSSTREMTATPEDKV